MLSLFKLPFWGRNHDDESQCPTNDLAQGIFKNYLSRQEFPSGYKNKEVQKLLESEFESLHQTLDETSPQDQYNLIEAMLRRVDDRLRGL